MVLALNLENFSQHTTLYVSQPEWYIYVYYTWYKFCWLLKNEINGYLKHDLRALNFNL